jgi:hypothetical protein
MAARFFRVAQVVAINAVLVLGFIWGRWTAGTVLALYWFENLASSILIALRVYIHRQLTNARGHYVLNTSETRTKTTYGFAVKKKRSIGTVLQGYLIFAVGFTIGHAIFLGVILAALSESSAGAAFNLDEFRQGALSIGAFLLLGFILDLGGIRQRPFLWITVITSMMYLRVIVIQFVVVLGVGLVAIFQAPRAAVVLFLILKLLVDLMGTQIKDELARTDDDLPFDAEARARLLSS